MTLSANGSAKDDEVLSDGAMEKPELTHCTGSDIEDPIFVFANVARVRPKGSLRETAARNDEETKKRPRHVEERSAWPALPTETK